MWKKLVFIQVVAIQLITYGSTVLLASSKGVMPGQQKKTSSVKKGAVKKTVPAKQPGSPAKKAAPAKKAVQAKKPAAKKPGSPAKKAAPAKKGAAKQPGSPAKKPAPVKNGAAKQTGNPAKQPAAQAKQTTAPAKQTEIPAKKPGIPVKQPESSAKQPEDSAKQPGVAAKQPGIPAKQPATPVKQPEVAAKQPAVSAKDPQVKTVQTMAQSIKKSVVGSKQQVMNAVKSERATMSGVAANIIEREKIRLDNEAKLGKNSEKSMEEKKAQVSKMETEMLKNEQAYQKRLEELNQNESSKLEEISNGEKTIGDLEMKLKDVGVQLADKLTALSKLKRYDDNGPNPLFKAILDETQEMERVIDGLTKEKQNHIDKVKRLRTHNNALESARTELRKRHSIKQNEILKRKSELEAEIREKQRKEEVQKRPIKLKSKPGSLGDVVNCYKDKAESSEEAELNKRIQGAVEAVENAGKAVVDAERALKLDPSPYPDEAALGKARYNQKKAREVLDSLKDQKAMLVKREADKKKLLDDDGKQKKTVRPAVNNNNVVDNTVTQAQQAQTNSAVLKHFGGRRPYDSDDSDDE